MFESFKKELKEFKKELKETPVSAFNVLCNTAAVKGDIFIEGDFRFDGKMVGNLECTGKITLGSASYIEGEITCKDAEISGKIKGNIKTTGLLSLKGTSKVEGEIVSEKLTVEVGAILSMKCTIENKSKESKDKIKEETPIKPDVPESQKLVEGLKPNVIKLAEIKEDLLKDSEKISEPVKKTRKRTKKIDPII